MTTLTPPEFNTHSPYTTQSKGLGSLNQPLGIRLTLSCDYSAKYLSRSFGLQEYRSTWSVLGHFDVLEATPIRGLDEAAREFADEARYRRSSKKPSHKNENGDQHPPVGGNADEQDNPADDNHVNELGHIGAAISLLLFPSGAMNAEPRWDHSTDDNLLFDRLANPHKHTNAPFCYITTLTFSPQTYERDSDYRGVFSCIEALDEWISILFSEIGITRHGRFCSLSGPDFVIIVFPKSPEEIQLCRELSARLSSLLLDDLLDLVNPSDNGVEKVRKCPGHAFASVEDFLAINGSEITDQKLQGTTRNQQSLSVTTELECECGHAESVASFFLSRGYPSTASDLEVDTSKSRVVIRGLSLSKYREVWKLVVEPNNREGNIYGVSSRLVDSFEIEKSDKDLECPLWELAPNLRLDLKNVRRAFFDAKTFITKQQLDRAWAAYFAFEACLRRPETATVAKELLAVFVQFSRMLHEPTLAAYLRNAASRSEFVEDLNRFLIYMDAAINGRVEQRRMIRDAPFPPALPTGATSVLSCYTAMFYLCWELLTRTHQLRRSNSIPEECPVENFSGGVVGGREGQVRCEELFRSFREHVERARAKKFDVLSPQPLSMLPEPKSVDLAIEGPWRGRICFFEVPSSLLLRTDDAFVQAIHETAELSEWVEHPENAAIRHKINYWSTSALAYAICEASPGKSHRTPDMESRMLTFATHCVHYLVAMSSRFQDEVGLTPPRHKNELQDILKQSCRQISPRRFYDYLWRAIIGASGDAMLVNKVERFFYSAPSKAPFEVFEIRATLAQRLEEVLDQFGSRVQIAHEVMPDVAMCEVLRTLLNRRPETGSEWVCDINRAYLGLFKVACASGDDGEVNDSEHMVAVRWALVLSVLIRGLRLKNVRWQDELTRSIRSLRLIERREQAAVSIVSKVEAKTAKMPELFHSGDSLSLEILLSSLQTFGGRDSVWMANYTEHFSQAELTLLTVFKDAWDSSELDRARLTLALNFWAKAQRLRHHKMIVPKAT